MQEKITGEHIKKEGRPDSKKGGAVREKLQICLDFLTRTDRLPVPVCACGFDGFIDTLTRPVFHDGIHKTAFQSTRQFAEYLLAKSGKNCGIDLEVKSRRFGGNSPIFSNALASSGVSVHCMAALGFPDTDPIFDPVKNRCATYNIENPGLCTALEFDDGKVFFAQNDAIKNINYKTVKNRLGHEKLSEIITQSHGLALLNWGEIKNMGAVWEEALQDFEKIACEQLRKKLLIDFADISLRSSKEIKSIISLLKNSQEWIDVFVSVNLNEYHLLCQVFALDDQLSEATLRKLFSCLGITALVVHTPQRSFFADAANFGSVNNKSVAKPRINTGAGDHFNAGFMFALLYDFDWQSALVLASACSGFFVANGFSPDKENLKEFMTHWQSDFI